MNSDLVLKIYDQWLKQAIAFHNFGRGQSKGELLGGSETVKSADAVSRSSPGSPVTSSTTTPSFAAVASSTPAALKQKRRKMCV